MAANVKFLKGTEAGYQALPVKDVNTFYYTETNLYLGTLKLTGGGDATSEDLSQALTRITKNEQDIDALEALVGELADLETTAKNNLVAAINELKEAIDKNKTDAKVTLESSTVDPDYSSVYTLKQGAEVIGTINVPKDMVVQSGAVVTDPEGQTPGTYLVLTLANSDDTVLYINVGSLVDIYSAQASAAEIQLAIDNNNEISATIVNNSIASEKIKDNAIITSKIADNAVTTVKILNKAITTDKIADEAVTADKIADEAITADKIDSTLMQTITAGGNAVKQVVTGTINGAIAVDGVNVPVFGLKSAAFTDSTDYDAAGAAATAESNAKAYADGLLSWGTF